MCTVITRNEVLSVTFYTDLMLNFSLKFSYFMNVLQHKYDEVCTDQFMIKIFVQVIMYSLQPDLSGRIDTSQFDDFSMKSMMLSSSDASISDNQSCSLPDGTWDADF